MPATCFNAFTEQAAMTFGHTDGHEVEKHQANEFAGIVFWASQAREQPKQFCDSVLFVCRLAGQEAHGYIVKYQLIIILYTVAL